MKSSIVFFFLATFLLLSTGRAEAASFFCHITYMDPPAAYQRKATVRLKAASKEEAKKLVAAQFGVAGKLDCHSLLFIKSCNGNLRNLECQEIRE